MQPTLPTPFSVHNHGLQIMTLKLHKSRIYMSRTGPKMLWVMQPTLPIPWSDSAMCISFANNDPKTALDLNFHQMSQHSRNPEFRLVNVDFFFKRQVSLFFFCYQLKANWNVYGFVYRVRFLTSVSY